MAVVNKHHSCALCPSRKANLEYHNEVMAATWTLVSCKHSACLVWLRANTCQAVTPCALPPGHYSFCQACLEAGTVPANLIARASDFDT